MAIHTFDPKELTVTGRTASVFGGPGMPIYDFPVSRKEGCLAMYRRTPIWQVGMGLGVEMTTFCPKVNPDNIARASVFDGTNTPQSGGEDMFGIQWEFIPQAGGSMVRPGKPFIKDANEIQEKVKWPDINTWDWDACRKANEGYLGTSTFISCMFLNGWYERLISFMDFEGAVVAMIDEDQKDAVKMFFDRLSDLYISIFEKYLDYFPQIDGFLIHDDWGSQKETFFSPDTAAEMLVPYMKRITDFLHSKGIFCDLHSCGQIFRQVPNIIAAGWDAWNPQVMNDTRKIYELYGDRLIVGVMPDPYDVNAASEEEQRARARAYADEFCKPGKPSALNTFAFFEAGGVTEAFREELYRQSRLNYGG